MALVIGNGTVATGMSPLVEGALYADQIFIDGMTFTSRYQIGNAGQIQVVVENRSEAGVTPKMPGSNFSDEEYANDVIDINCNNAFSKSVKVPDIYGASMPVNVLANKTWEVTAEVRDGRQNSGLAVLAKNGTAKKVTSVAASGIKQEFIASRSALRKSFAKPDVVLCSVDTYAAILDFAGKEFTPMFNDDVMRSGAVGRWLNMVIVECDALSNSGSFVYLDAEGKPVTVDMSGINYIMYDHSAFSIIDRLDALRVIESEMFAGRKVQEELSVGFKVTRKGAVLVGMNELPTNSGGDDESDTPSEQSLFMSDIDA